MSAAPKPHSRVLSPDEALAGLLEAAAQFVEHGYPKSGALIEECGRSLFEQLEKATAALREIAHYECEPHDDDIIEAHIAAAYNDLAKIAREALGG